MKNLAPHITRQRLLIEGFYTAAVDEDFIRAYFTHLTQKLDLRVYGDPIIFAPATGIGKDENAGYDAFVPLIDSGISLYVWSSEKFMSVIIYTCKDFAAETAIAETAAFFDIDEIVSQTF